MEKGLGYEVWTKKRHPLKPITALMGKDMLMEKGFRDEV
jgi:hypothetical protein